MKHLIKGEIYHDTAPCFLKIDIDSNTVFQSYFDKQVEHELNIEFNHEYKSNSIHQMIVHFDSDIETEKKYIKINNILINQQFVPIANAFYTPKDTEWWHTPEAKNAKVEKVYKHGNYFGWLGQIYFYYYTNALIADSWQSALGITDKIIFSNIDKVKR